MEAFRQTVKQFHYETVSLHSPGDTSWRGFGQRWVLARDWLSKAAEATEIIGIVDPYATLMLAPSQDLLGEFRNLVKTHGTDLVLTSACKHPSFCMGSVASLLGFLDRMCNSTVCTARGDGRQYLKSAVVDRRGNIVVCADEPFSVVEQPFLRLRVTRSGALPCVVEGKDLAKCVSLLGLAPRNPFPYPVRFQMQLHTIRHDLHRRRLLVPLKVVLLTVQVLLLSWFVWMILSTRSVTTLSWIAFALMALINSWYMFRGCIWAYLDEFCQDAWLEKESPEPRQAGPWTKMLAAVLNDQYAWVIATLSPFVLATGCIIKIWILCRHDRHASSLKAKSSHLM